MLNSHFGGVPTLSVEGCDFGADGASDDNTPTDLWLYPADQTVEYGDDASFTCTSAGCI